MSHALNKLKRSYKDKETTYYRMKAQDDETSNYLSKKMVYVMVLNCSKILMCHI